MTPDTATLALPLHRLRRSTDPDTSLLAAIRAHRASRKAVAAVQAVMADGIGRIDQEIWLACRANGYVSSLDTVEHGRLALVEAGLLRDSGLRRDTADGMPSRVWVAT